MSLYLCDPQKNKKCTNSPKFVGKYCYASGGPCFMTCDPEGSAGGNELNDDEISAMERMLEMRLRLEQKRLWKKRRRRQKEEGSEQ